MKWPHKCPKCDGYFRNEHHPAIYPLTCPYCGLRSAAHKFLTDAQHVYLKHYIETLQNALDEIEPGTERELVIDMDAAADQSTEERRPDFYYAAETQQTRYNCEKCGDFNDIRGRYGYCASCGWRNNVSFLKTSFASMRDSLNGGRLGPEDTVRSAVSEFDACCKDIAVQLRKRIPMKPERRADLERLIFHDADSPTIKMMKSMFDIDINLGVGQKLPFVRMMMHRRHVFEHNAGVADAQYVSRSGDPDGREGVLIRETQANAHQLMNCLIRMAENFERDFHQIFVPTEWPINYFRERQERMRGR